MSLFIVGLFIYGIFAVPVGDRTMAKHCHEIWQSPIVQKKVKHISEAIKQSMEKQFDQLTQQFGHHFSSLIKNSDVLQEHISEQDRLTFERLLEATDTTAARAPTAQLNTQ